MGDTNENEGSLCNAKVATRTNCECLSDLGYELRELDYKIIKLKNAIAANPLAVAESAKNLWPVQLEAMKSYKKALQARIIELIENDKD